MNLQSEPVTFKQTKDGSPSDPGPNLRLNGATEEEIEFLRGTLKTGAFHGRRVELNAMTSDQFVDWLDLKLKEHQIKKVVPDTHTLVRAYKRASAITRLNAVMREALIQIETEAEAIEVPNDIAERLSVAMAKSSCVSWDQALDDLLLQEERG